jgi:hypothetical protein
MLGGYGENFKAPHSLLTNYYYEIIVNTEFKTLISIEKKILDSNVVPINIKQAIKNRGVFQKANILDRYEQLDTQ